MKNANMIALFLATCLLVKTTQGQTQRPRVLILGDSIYQPIGRSLTSELKDKVEVVTPAIQPGEIRNSSTALENIDQWVGTEKWDLIHFNFGLGDLIYRAPGMKSFRVMAKDAGGIRATKPQDYENNLRELVRRLKSTNATLVWANTTPIRHSASNVFVKGSEIEYNAIAEKVMIEEKVAVNDMFEYAKSLMDMNKPAPHGFDPFYFDKKPLHASVAKIILKKLNK
jgi:hypothetical protein